MGSPNEEALLPAGTLQETNPTLVARQRAEDELLRAKEFHDAVMASMGEGLYTVDGQGLVTYMNPVAEKLFGWTLAELLGRKMHEMTHYKHPDGTPFPASACAGLQVMKSGRPLRDYDDVFIRKDGGFFPVTYSSSPLRTGDKIEGLIVVFRDTTERRRAEEAQLNLAAIVESSDDAIVSKDLNGIIRSWNKGAERIFGYSAAEITGKPITVLLPRERLHEEAEILRRLRLGESVEHFDTIRRHKSGRLIQVSVTISPIRDSKGKIIGASKIARDITERKRSEQTTRFLASANAALADLADHESTLQKVANLAVPAFADWCAVDLAEKNGALRSLVITHSDPAKVGLAQEIRRRFPPKPSDNYGVTKVLRTRESDWKPQISDALLASAIADTEQRRLIRELGVRSYICVPLISRNATIGGLTFATAESGRAFTEDDLRAAQDLAHRLVIAIENANLVAALKETDQRKDEFLAILAHELRNPLAPIRNAVDIIRDQQSPVPEMQWARDVIDRQVDQMTRLIDDLLDISRITRGTIELRKESVQLATVVANAIEASRPLVEARRHGISITLPPEPCFLEADPARLAQVLSNLLNNAAKYMEEGGHIWLTGERERGQIVVRVKDTGVGIAPEMLPRIFDLFTQADHTLERSQGGLGIGLTLVRRLVAMHGGTVQASSAGPGKGSEFVVCLPVGQAAGAPASPVPRDHAARTVTAQALRILVVDDNKDAANGLAKLLRLSGHEVHTAYDGLEGLGAAAMFQPNVAILDIGLPHLNGFEVAHRIRVDRGNKVTLIAVTGWGQDSDRRKSKEAGFDHHVTKPLEFAALKKLLASIAMSGD